jgi:FKBP-type peptidyl-prolyl cis-trans isomerase
MRCAWISGLVLAGVLCAAPVYAQTAADNLKAGQAYLKTIARQPGVVTLPSGVMYRVVSRSPQPGAQPTVADTVTIDYEGKLLSGSVFDSSYARHEPASFPLGRLIPAWQQAIPQMHVGDEIILYTPASQAYGDRDLSPDIPPNSTLVFRVHLIGIGGQ